MRNVIESLFAVRLREEQTACERPNKGRKNQEAAKEARTWNVNKPLANCGKGIISVSNMIRDETEVICEGRPAAAMSSVRLKIAKKTARDT
jgi:hypothetical protein